MGVFAALQAWHLAEGSREGLHRERTYPHEPSTSVAAMDTMSRATRGLRGRYKTDVRGLAGAVTRTETGEGHDIYGKPQTILRELRDGVPVYVRINRPLPQPTTEYWGQGAAAPDYRQWVRRRESNAEDEVHYKPRDDDDWTEMGPADNRTWYAVGSREGRKATLEAVGTTADRAVAARREPAGRK